MKKFLFLSIFLLIIGCGSILAQRGNNPRGNRVGSPPTARTPKNIRVRNTNASEIQRRKNTVDRNNRPEIERRKPKKISKLLRGLNLSDRQKRKTKQILKEAKENGTPKNEVLREINSILNPRQSKKFKKKIKRIYQNQNGNGDNPPPPTDDDDSQTGN